MSQQPDPQTLKAAVPCTTVLQQFKWQTEDNPRDQTVTWREPNAPPSAPPIITSHNGQGFHVPGTQTKGDVFDLVGYLDPSLTSFAARRARIAGMANPADLERARTAPPSVQTIETEPDRTSYARLWVTHHPLKDASPAHIWLIEQRGVHPIVVQAAVDQDELREGPKATVWAAHRDATGGLTGWDAEGPEFKAFAAKATRALFTLDAANGQATRIAIADTPIEAMSLATVERMRDDTIYAAVSGMVGPETATTLRNFIDRIDPGQRSIVIATPTNDAGNALADRLASIAHDAGIVPDRIFPSHGQQDFNAMINPNRDRIARAPENDGNGTPPRPDPVPGQPLRAEPMANTPTSGGTTPPTGTINTIERGQPREIADNTKISIDIGQSSAGYHYKTQVTLNNHDLPAPDWSRPFETQAQATESATFSAGRDVERAVAADAGGKGAAAQATKDPYQRVLDELAKNTAGLPGGQENDKLKQRIADLSERAKQPGELNDPAVRQEIAWAMIDTERASGIKTAMPQALRDDMLVMATTIQGLMDERLIRLMKTTSMIANQETVDKIRDLAVRAVPRGAERAGISEMHAMKRLEIAVLDENIDRMTQRERAGRDQTASTDQGQTTQANKQAEQSVKPATDAAQKPVVQATTANVKIEPGANTGPGWLDSAAAKFKSAFRGDPNVGNGADPAANGTARPAPTEAAPYANTNFDHQAALDNFERGTRIEGVADAAATATSALSALQKLMGGISQKIEAAADNDAGGYASVMSGMKPGGQYAELRSELDAQLLQSQDLAGTFQQAAAAVQDYAAKRLDTEAWFKTNGGKVAELDKELAPIEKDLFSALEKTPGKTAGMSMLDELAERIGNAIVQIIDRARTAMGFGSLGGTDPTPTSPTSPQNEQRPGPRPG